MARSSKKPPPGLAIIAGGGKIPLAVADAAKQSGRPLHIFALSGAAEPAVESFPHCWINFGHIGKILSVSRMKNLKDLVIVGAVRRPQWKDLRFDLGAILNFPILFSWTTGGDNSVLSRIIRFFEKKGFNVVGAHDIAPDLLAGQTCLTRRKPTQSDRLDITIGLQVIEALGGLDVGQAVVVSNRYVLAVEAAEGTDEMLSRCKQLNSYGKGGNRRAGVLVKRAKPGQERRIDLPTVGPRTVRRAAEAGLSGIAIAANEVLIVDREEFVADANTSGLFVVGLGPDGSPPE